MKNTLNTLHIVLAIPIIAICGLAVINYGWIGYSTFTDRGGAHGNMYWYYRMDQTVFGLYQLIVASLATLIIASIIYFFCTDKKPQVIKSFYFFLVFLLVIILCEVYLNSRYVGKG